MMVRTTLHATLLLLLLIGCSPTSKTRPADPALLQLREEQRLLAIYSTNPLPRMETLEQRRIETPHGQMTLQCYAPGGRDLPVILLLPSIDFQSGDVVTHDRIARTLAIDTPAVVILPTLPQTPEATLQTSIEVAAAALDWMNSRIDRLGGATDCLTIVGEGAAALHALRLAAMQRGHNDTALRGLVLVTPVLHPYPVPAPDQLNDLPEIIILSPDTGTDRDAAVALAAAIDAAGTPHQMRVQPVDGALRLDWALASAEIYDTVLEVTRLVRRLAAGCSGDQESETF